MRNKIARNIAGALLGGAVLAAGHAQAATLIVTAPFTALSLGGTQTVTIAPFDTTLGTLTAESATLANSYSFGGTVTNTNSGAIPSAVGVLSGFDGGSSTFTLTDPGTVLSFTTTASSDANFTTLLTNKTLNLSASYTTLPDGSTAPVSGNGSSTSTRAATGLADFLAGFSITDTLTAGTPTVTGADGISTAVTATDTPVLTFTETYTPAATGVPEPATFAILGAGILGLVMVRRRRNV